MASSKNKKPVELMPDSSGYIEQEYNREHRRYVTANRISRWILQRQVSRLEYDS